MSELEGHPLAYELLETLTHSGTSTESAIVIGWWYPKQVLSLGLDNILTATLTLWGLE